MTNQYGLIGFPLKHSFSPGYFNEKFAKENIDAFYKTYELKEIGDFLNLVKEISFSGLNVTIPYKETIMPFLDEIDEVAQEIGAVNTILFNDNGTKGYNSDVYGFENSLMSLIQKSENVNSALILGHGGASKAVKYVLKKLGISFLIVSRSKGDLTYEHLNSKDALEANLIINTTPLGMFPHVNEKPKLPYKNLNENYFLYDLVYNPEKTLFLTEGMKVGCKVKNGYDMLLLQAERSWQIWNQPEK